MRDKNSGRSRGFAFITFIVYPTLSEVGEAKNRIGSNNVESQDFCKCKAAIILNDKMLKPEIEHLVLGRAVEIRQSDGGKPQDSFIIKKKE
jgi:hypothetical protein